MPAVGKRVAILQSNYIPWKGYFDIIAAVDEFILYDQCQYTKNDWRNRNKIKTAAGVQWLTIPVFHRLGQRIEQTVISDPTWARWHWNALVANYAKAEFFAVHRGLFHYLYSGLAREKLLSVVNYRFLSAICSLLGIRTKITSSRDYPVEGNATERIVGICEAAGATEYLSGPSAKDYIDESCFERAGIKLTYANYDGYPEYRQLFGPFRHDVSVIDLIFNEGPRAPEFMKSFKEALCL